MDMTFSSLFTCLIVILVSIKQVYAEVHYKDDAFLDVKISINDDDWSSLRRQKRDLFTQYFSCSQAWDSPYTWFKANVTIDNETMYDVGLRKKGFIGSSSSSRPSLKIDSDRFIDDQEFDDGTEHITLNNNKQDPSRAMTCLAYDIFRGAGYPAPLCNVAKVSVNGEYMQNVYTHVEPIKKDFLKRNFESHKGNLYEGTLTDFVIDWLPDGEETRWEVKRGPDEDVLLAPILRNISQVLQDTPDEVLEEDLFLLVNNTRFFDFWALEIITGHIDGYTANQNNFYVYSDPTYFNDKIVFLPWGIDRYGKKSIDTFLYAEIPRRLSRLPHMRTLLLQSLRNIMDNYFDEDMLWSRVETRLSGLLSSEEIKKKEELHVWLKGRRQDIEDILNDASFEGRSSQPTCRSVDTIRLVAGLVGGFLGLAFISIVVYFVVRSYRRKTSGFSIVPSDTQ